MSRFLLGLWRIIWVTAVMLISLAVILLCLVVWYVRRGNQP